MDYQIEFSTAARSITSIGVALVLMVTIHGSESTTSFEQPARITKLLDSYCLTCHDGDTMKGDVRLDNLQALSLGERLDLLNNAQEQLFSGEMPPKKKAQPTSAERESLLSWIAGELDKHKASKLADKLRYYRYGNLINHEKLFSGKVTDKPFTPGRRWRINEIIYMELINNVLGLSGGRRKKEFHGIVKPFNLPTESGVRYYDTEIVDGGQFLTLLSNAEWTVSKQVHQALVKRNKENPAYKPPETNRADNLRLSASPEPFEKVIMADAGASDDDLKAAISYQFNVALQRSPNSEELTRYMRFIQDNRASAGTAIALEKALVAILMEPDFIYRSEFGAGKPDAYGRVLLTAREASYAISYALTDQIPDEELVAAAKSNKLVTKQDYKREVTRILDDDKIEKTRLLRFFQDYFGYDNVYNVFKDEKRFVGAYNPHRVISKHYIYRVPGKVMKEADTLIKHIIDKDKDVLKELLTTDNFFVDHNGNNEEMAKRAKAAADQDKANRSEYINYIQNKGRNKDGSINLKGLGRKRLFWFVLYGNDGKLGMGRQAIPFYGEGIEHSVKMYNLDLSTWSYDPVQPFKIENRCGILTHPAWLVAFSQNAETDPVRRGKWIQEKLLGGFIPDVPITVDAKVPEDHHKTLRERFSVVEQGECWRCHVKMNPLGNAFEEYDDFGRYRTEEMLEYDENIIEKRTELARNHNGIIRPYEVNIYKTKPVNATGHLEGTGNKQLDGDVKNAIDLMQRISKSERVRQTFIRNVFRYFMGRNEMFSDSQTLIEADRAYVDSGGSFKALVISLLTSDSFIYRKPNKD